MFQKTENHHFLFKVTEVPLPYCPKPWEKGGGALGNPRRRSFRHCPLVPSHPLALDASSPLRLLGGRSYRSVALGVLVPFSQSQTAVLTFGDRVRYRTRAFKREGEKTGSSGGFSRRGFSLSSLSIQGPTSEEHTASCPPTSPSGPARPRPSGSETLTFTGQLGVPRTLSLEPSSCEPRCCYTCVEEGLSRQQSGSPLGPQAEA